VKVSTHQNNLAVARVVGNQDHQQSEDNATDSPTNSDHRKDRNADRRLRIEERILRSENESHDELSQAQVPVEPISAPVAEIPFSRTLIGAIQQFWEIHCDRPVIREVTVLSLRPFRSVNDRPMVSIHPN
jgi:hypothetical protein